MTLDINKIAEEEKFDGYYSIVTSELNMSDYEMRDTYRGLAKIEETFKISKGEFGNKYPVAKIITSLRKYNCTQIDTTI